MNALIRKEIRLMLWPFLAAVLLAVVPGWMAAIRSAQVWEGRGGHQVIFEVYVICFTLGVVVLSLTTFGQEFSLRTFTFTLAQPIERKTIWRIKTAILAGAILLMVASLAISLQLLRISQPTLLLSPEKSVWSVVTVTSWIAVATGGLWTSLLFRNFFVALSLSVLIPGELLVLFSKQIFGVNASYSTTFVAVLLGSYSIAGFILARWQFLRAQDVMWGGGEISISRRRFKRWAILGSFMRTNPFFALLRKELQMQQVAFVVAAILLVCHLASFPIRALVPNQSDESLFIVALNFICVIWVALPLLIGSAAVADERRLGTFEAFLTQPVSRRTQIIVKLVVVLLLSIIFGALVPYGLEHLAQALGAKTTLMPNDLTEVVIVSVCLAIIAFFSSCIARSSLDAFCISILVIWPILGVIAVFHFPNGLHSVPAYGILSPYILIACMVPTVVWLAWKNFQRIQVRWTAVAGTWLVLALSMLTAWGAASFVWYRGWESFMSLEPKHAKRVMHLGDSVKVVPVKHGAFVLLPDGRIWSAEYEFNVCRDDRGEEYVRGVSLQDTHFLPGKWLDLAGGVDPCAIGADGTLWLLKPHPSRTNAYQYAMEKAESPQQIGHGSDWASISGAHHFTLGLKRDGSLWAWGFDSFPHIPKNIWPGTHWQKIFATEPLCFGIQSDGTTWQWPALDEKVPPADQKLQPTSFVGSNWTSFSSGVPFHFATRDDHTLWSSPGRWHDDPNINWNIFGQPVDRNQGLHQVGQDHDWFSLTSLYPLCALKTDGSWWVHDGGHLGRPERGNLRVSRYSDWVAIDSDIVMIGVAADGTVSSWMSLDNYPYYTGPSRAPTWSTNIFATR